MTVDEYLKLPYNYIVKEINDESGHYYYAKILELEGCQTTTNRFSEIDASLKDAMRGHIQMLLDNNDKVPVPKQKSELSGKLVLRMPSELHLKLSVEAKEEGVSLNQYLLYKLSK